SRTSREVKRLRRVIFEQLEQRLPLDGGLASATLSSAQRQALLDGLNGVASWTDSLESFNKLAQQVSLVDTSIGQELAVHSLLQNQLIAPLTAASLPTSDALVAVLNGLSITAGDLTVTVNPA